MHYLLSLVVATTFAVASRANPNAHAAHMPIRYNPGGLPKANSQLPLAFVVDPEHPDRPAPQAFQIGQIDSPVFGESCKYRDTFSTCGDYFDVESGVDHALFCSPKGICAGIGAACGQDESCGEGLQCNTLSHRCVPDGTFVLTAAAVRLEQRRQMALRSCPEGSEACFIGSGFQCLHTNMDNDACGGCPGAGGTSCAGIQHAVSSSCKEGECVVYSCEQGFVPSEDGTTCEEEP